MLMDSPTEPVTLSRDDIRVLDEKLSTMRHNVNNYLSLIIAAAEVMRRRPEMAARLSDSLTEQPGRITQEVQRFSDEFERALRISRNAPQ